tara:strand:- start:1964 stop:2080 length:117 start_codon:yes stop_codon:yes gene_type:complete
MLFFFTLPTPTVVVRLFAAFLITFGCILGRDLNESEAL